MIGRPTRPVLHDDSAGLSHVVMADDFQFPLECRPVDHVQQDLYGAKLQQPFMENEIISFRRERYEIQPERQRGGVSGYTTVSLPRIDLPRGCDVARNNMV